MCWVAKVTMPLHAVVFTTPLNTITSTYHLDWEPFPDTHAPVVLDNKWLEVEINSIYNNQ